MITSDPLRFGRARDSERTQTRDVAISRETATPANASVTNGADETDAAIVTRAKRDPAAFAPLYARYAGPVFGYCLRRLRDRDAADDATSLTFVRVLAALPRCRGDQFRPWLFSIAHNVTTDALRGRARVGARSTAPPVHDDRPDTGRLPEELALDREGEDRVQSLIAALSQDQRQIVELRLAGLTGAEIATVLGRSHGAIRIAQLRAYRRLREVIGAGG